MRLEIKEHSTITTSELTQEDVQFINEKHPTHLKINQLLNNNFELKTNQNVGLIVLPSGIEISIKPKIPILNLLYMVSVVHEVPNFKYPDTSEEINDNSLLEIYAIVLLNWIEFLVKKGLYKAYFRKEELIKGLKGKYLMERNLISKQQIWCEFDDISFDTTENRIIKSTLFYLLKSPISEKSRQRALTLIRLFAPISFSNLSNELFSQPIYHKLNYHYKTIIELCYLIFKNLRLSDSPGKNPFSGFIVDMNKLFQNFILRTLKNLFPGEKVSPSVKRQWAVDMQKSDHLPELEPDILIDGKFIIDTKYYNSPINDYNKFHSHNLYQLITYMTAYHLSGMLLYPENEGPIDESFRFGDHVFSVKTVNLKKGIEQIESELLGLARDFMEAVEYADNI